MANCYVHMERQATSSCAICGKGICRECSNWAAGDLYLCPQCWRMNAPSESVDAEQARRKVAAPLFGAWVSRALYYVIAALVVIIGVWYVYATFIAPSVLAPSGLGPPPLQLGDIWSRYKLIITASVSMFLIVLIAGEIMLRAKPRERQSTAVQSEVKLPSRTFGARPMQTQSVAVQSEVKLPSKTLGARPMQTQSVILQSEAQPRIQTLRPGPEPSQTVIAQSEVPRPSQAEFVFCIYCGNRILASANVCDKCHKAQ